MLPTQYNNDFSPMNRRFNPLGAAMNSWVGLLIVGVGALLLVSCAIAFYLMMAEGKDFLATVYGLKVHADYAYKVLGAIVILGFVGFSLMTGRGMQYLLLAGVVSLSVFAYQNKYISFTNTRPVLQVATMQDVSKNYQVSRASVAPVALSVNGNTQPMQPGTNYYQMAQKLGLKKGRPLNAGELQWCKANFNKSNSSRINCGTRHVWVKG